MCRVFGGHHGRLRGPGPKYLRGQRRRAPVPGNHGRSPHGGGPRPGRGLRRDPAGGHRGHAARWGRRGGDDRIHRRAPGRNLEVRRAVAPGENVLAPGEDVARGEGGSSRAGRRLRPQEIGLLAALGVGRIAVYNKPRVAIISSGDEIVPREARPGPGQVRDSNAYLAAAQVADWGGLPQMYGIIPDDLTALRKTLAAALEAADLILVSGGSSVGARDLTLTAIQDLPDAQVLVHGVALRPGKPTILAALGQTRPRPLLGLPGHPASAAVVMEVLGRPLLMRLAGVAGPAPWGRLRNRHPVPEPGRGLRPGGLRPGAPPPGGRHPVGRPGPGAFGAPVPPGVERRPGDDPSGGGRPLQRGPGCGCGSSAGLIPR